MEEQELDLSPLHELLAQYKEQHGAVIPVLQKAQAIYVRRRGRHIIRQCDGTACHVRGAAKIVQAVESYLGIKAGETTDDYKYTYEVVYCLGSCGLAPVSMIDDRVVGHLVPERMIDLLKELD
jgi:NADH-quinone oxidoreductase subunit E